MRKRPRLGVGSSGVDVGVVRFDALAGRLLMGEGWLSRWEVGSWEAGKLVELRALRNKWGLLGGRGSSAAAPRVPTIFPGQAAP